jgi:2-methylisocitrate lyase-like PEP mutase family enzyme
MHSGRASDQWCDWHGRDSAATGRAMLKAAVNRAHAYAHAGADGLFAPGLVDQGMIARLAAASPLPLNVMVSDETPSFDALADSGVARVSHGPGPYSAMMKKMEELARAAMRTEPPETVQV